MPEGRVTTDRGSFPHRPQGQARAAKPGLRLPNLLNVPQLGFARFQVSLADRRKNRLHADRDEKSLPPKRSDPL